jgi:uncharacterized protein YndB with AHSA1/START domain
MIDKVFSVEIAAPPERVWTEITRTGSRCRPMFGTMLVSGLARGAPIRWRSVNGKFTFVAGEIVEIERPRRLVHTFVFPNLPDAPTLVTWELSPTASGTRVTVTHARFEGETKTWKAVYGSWPKILGLFKQVIEKGDVDAGTKIMHALMGAMSFVLPKSLRTDVVEAELTRHPPRIEPAKDLNAP